MPTDFLLRAMQPSDGPALQRLMENDPVVGPLASTTHFLVDAYRAWITLKPTLIGMVAEAPGFDGLAAAVTMALDDAQFDGRLLSGAYLENLKVDQAFRGQRLGARIVEAAAAEARQRIGDGVIFTGMSADNAASIASMKSWSKQVVGPLAVAARPTRSHPPRPLPGITVRAAEPRELAEIAEQSNRFYADYNLYPPQSAEKLSALLAAAPAVYHYHIAVDRGGKLLAGALVTERARLMIDQIQNVPLPVAIINRALRLIPADHQLRMAEVNLFWFEQLAAGRQLWQTLKWLYHDQADILAASFDPRGPLRDVYQLRPWHLPKIAVTMVVGGPTAMDTHRLLAQPPRG